MGSDLLFTARFEGNDFDEWTSSRFGGSFGATPTPANAIAVSAAHAHTGSNAAQLSIDAGPDGTLNSASMSLRQDLPVDAYYSAWYFLPRSTTVNVYWVIMKFRRRTDAADPSTETELFDIDLYNLPGGEMSIRLFDHRSGSNAPMLIEQPLVTVNGWFQVEARYRNTNDSSGRMTVWLDRNEILDLSGPVTAVPWTEWVVLSLGDNLTPSSNVIYVDDCAMAGSRVGPDGVLTGP